MKRCPICEKAYGTGVNHRRRESRHHIFPRKMYPGSGLVVHVCQECHDEFNRMFPYEGRKWSTEECIINWVIFCDRHQRRPLDAYPELIEAFCYC